MLQSNLILHQPAQEKHCKQSVEDTSITATAVGSGLSKLLLRVTSLSTNGSLELVFVDHISVHSQTGGLSNYIYVK